MRLQSLFFAAAFFCSSRIVRETIYLPTPLRCHPERSVVEGSMCESFSQRTDLSTPFHLRLRSAQDDGRASSPSPELFVKNLFLLLHKRAARLAQVFSGLVLPHAGERGAAAPPSVRLDGPEQSLRHPTALFVRYYRKKLLVFFPRIPFSKWLLFRHLPR